MDEIKIRKLCTALDSCTDGIREIRQTAEAGDAYAAARKLVEHFKTRTKPCYFYDALYKKHSLDIAQKDKVYREEVISEADRIMGHKPRMYGVNVDFGDDRIWDFVQYGADSTYGGLINRLEWLLPIGQAYWLTDNPVYAEFFLKVVRSWIAANPLKIKQALVRGQGLPGLPWNNSLDIGFRLKNLVALFAYFRSYEGWRTADYIDYLYLILQHGRILYLQQGNLFGSNWQTQECEGLAHAAILFPEFEESPDWYDAASLRFSQHAGKLLTQPDGTYHEPTPGYFSAVRGHLFSFMALSRLNGYQVEDTLEDSVERMFTWFMKMTMQDGYMPMAGDTTLADPRKGLALGAALFGRSDFKYVSGYRNLPTEFVWLVSREQFDAFAILESRKPDPSYTCLADCQYILLRDDWERLGCGNCLFFDVNPVALGHNHFDYLNIEVVLGGERLITESGHLGYAHMFRLKYVVGLIGHNILMIDDGTMQEVWLKETLPRISATYFSEAYDYVEGRVIYPAKEGDGSMEWRRGILYIKPDLFVVSDLVKGHGEHDIARLFHAGLGTETAFLQGSHGIRIAGRKNTAYVVSVPEPDLSLSDNDGLENFDGKLDVSVFRHRAALPMRTMTVIANGLRGDVPSVSRLHDEHYLVTYGNDKWYIRPKDIGDHTCLEIREKSTRRTDNISLCRNGKQEVSI